MTIDVRTKETERNKTNSKNHDLTPKYQHMPSKRHLTECELMQIVGGDGSGDPPPPIDPDHTGQQHNEHHLRWKKAGQDRTDPKKRELKPGKRH